MGLEQDLKQYIKDIEDSAWNDSVMAVTGGYISDYIQELAEEFPVPGQDYAKRLDQFLEYISDFRKQYGGMTSLYKSMFATQIQIMADYYIHVNSEGNGIEEGQ